MMIQRLSGVVAMAALASSALAQTPAPIRADEHGAAGGDRPPVRHVQAQRAGLFWEEKWRENPKGLDEAPIDMAGSVRNPDLELKLYGPAPKLMILGKDNDPLDKARVFSGEAKGPMTVMWRNKKAYADMTGLAYIRVATTMSGFHKLYPTVKLANGDFYVADRATTAGTKSWATDEIPLIEARWIKLDPANAVTKGNFVDKIDLSKVDEVGFTDLLPSSGHGPGGYFMLGEVDVYAKPVAR